MPVCITGMHRSGTSMVANLLSSCGLHLGAESTLIGTSRDNLHGYWENREFVRINNGILSDFGSGWDYPQRLSGEWHRNGSLLRYRERAEALLKDFNDCEPWGWKDPRSSLTLPFWLSLLPQTRVVICLRNPLEVIHSLHRRRPPAYTIGLMPWKIYDHLHAPLSLLRQRLWQEPVEFAAWKFTNRVRAVINSRVGKPSFISRIGRVINDGYDLLDHSLKLRRRKPLSYRIGLQLWELYNRHVLEYTAPHNRIITHYDAHFAHPQKELRRILAFLDMTASAETIERACQAAATELRHNQYTKRHLRNAGVSQDVYALYELMCKEAGFVAP